MTFKLSQKSLDKLKGVNEKLIAVVHDAIKITTVDFMVGEGLRTLERQKLLVAQNKSKTLKSKHITGQAVDLWAYAKGSVSWDLKYYYDIAHAMRDSAIKNNVTLIWGAVWDKPLNHILNTELEPTLYSKRREDIGKSAFIDAVHFELQ
jgi:peptidoglycan L-alanyl-D-glutamate endopeptidase CwlK